MQTIDAAEIAHQLPFERLVPELTDPAAATVVVYESVTAASRG
jgi:hypothetical protein